MNSNRIGHYPTGRINWLTSLRAMARSRRRRPCGKRAHSMSEDVCVRLAEAVAKPFGTRIRPARTWHRQATACRSSQRWTRPLPPG